MTQTLAIGVAAVVAVVAFAVIYTAVLVRSPKSRAIAIAGGALVGVAASASTYGIATIAVGPAPTPNFSRKTCPNHDLIAAMLQVTPQGAPAIVKSVEEPDTPEFHDCQRLVKDDGTGALSYGALVAVLATKPIIPPTAVELVAVVWSLDGAPYDLLGIKGGFNCLFLPTGSQQATMVPVNSSQDCQQLASVGTLPPGGTTLRVVYNSTSAAPQDIPAVARWDYDTANQRNNIVVKCGDRWCEIGPDDGLMQTRPPVDPNGGRVKAIKGWYDQQLLAEGGTIGTPLSVGPVTGTLIPETMLDALKDDNDWPVGRWIQVATANLDGDSPTYRTKLGLEHGDNKIELCRGDWLECTKEMLPPSSPLTCNDPTQIQNQNWWARVTAPGAAPGPPRCISRFDHSAVIPQTPGSARWRWVADDEHMWVRCSTGCCEIY